MTLIVARKSGNKIIINSDTRLTYEKIDQHDPDPKRIQHHRPTEGTVKTINLTPDVNLSFAGDVSIAEKVLSHFNGRVGEIVEFNLNNLIGHLNYLHMTSDRATDFILSIGDPDPINTKIIVIKDGVVADVPVAWIGSHDAFSIFQKTFMSLDDKEALKKQVMKSAETQLFTVQLPTNDEVFNDLYLRTHFAMREVVLGELVEDVGGFVVSSVFNGNSYKYLSYFECYPIGFGRTKSFLSGSNQIPLGSAAEGSYAVSIGGNCTYNLPIYFPHGKFGMIYSRENSSLMSPSPYYDCEAEQFQEIVRGKKIHVNFSVINFSDNSFTLGQST